MNTKILSPNDIEKQIKYMNSIKEANDRFAIENGFRKGAFVMTFGCQQNEADSEKIAGMAEAMGYEILNSPEKAYLIIICLLLMDSKLLPFLFFATNCD